MNVCILGGGNIGTLLMGDIGTNKNISVRLFTSRPDEWNHIIEVCDNDGTIKHTGRIDVISSNPEEVIRDADIIISTLPSYIFSKTIQRIKPFFKKGVWIGMMPGNGGGEFYCNELIENGCTIFGFQRVYGISRLKEYGKSVYDLGKKDELFIGAIPARNTTDVCKALESILNMTCNPLENFLQVSLTPANPILHTARLYGIFNHYKEEVYFENMIQFYNEWTDECSEMLIATDEEVQNLCLKLGTIDLNKVGFVKEYFGADSVKQMTAQISNKPALKNIQSPLIKTEKGYIPDFNSRYFLEDFPYGLCIIKSFCELVEVKTPFIDKILMWFENFFGVEYYVDGRFAGKDLKGLPRPQNFGINSIEDVFEYYK
ncbi:NAD/NADP octopine/nopaline dehydrogenase family protein [Clostridium psychrophilum]|uniref:NAD/NADP octopine/nopaline dehydrogenase family protein n=1 Tax=Clostridium psychrophilum TaxID=132926 RepID=UPI001C0CDF49|nr:NAD/NADP octopine/nopaline dehydrogenase family protein [Clostridium psychrophilum]MBU3182051.1 NAD/NADP octopine/nopaline dehydrogenase family protein [Clostridium psychrophilum]